MDGGQARSVTLGVGCRELDVTQWVAGGGGGGGQSLIVTVDIFFVFVRKSCFIS